MKYTIYQYILSMGGIFLIIFAAGLFFVAIYPFEVLDVKTPMEVISKKVYQGDCVFVMMDYDQLVDGPSTITAQVVTTDNIIIASTLLGLYLKKGKHTTKVGFMLPRNINLASARDHLEAKLLITSRFAIFGFRNIDVTYCTENFDIILDK